MVAKPIDLFELHYTMIQILIFAYTVNVFFELL